jgi:hypothetical protein
VPIEFYFAMHDTPAILGHHRVTFFTTEYFAIKLERGHAIADDQVWNKLICPGHRLSS